MIIAGPNGSGKSSTYHGSDVEIGGRSVWIIHSMRARLILMGLARPPRPKIGYACR